MTQDCPHVRRAEQYKLRASWPVLRLGGGVRERLAQVRGIRLASRRVPRLTVGVAARKANTGWLRGD